LEIPLNYIFLDFLIIIFPFLFSFKWKFKYYKFYKPLFASILIVGGVYILWDVIVTARGDWWFNHKYLMGLEIAGLPIEEILFFVTVPYACIFIYENLNFFVGEKPVSFNKYFYLGLFVVFLISGLLFYYQDYTILSLLSCAAFFLLASTLYPNILKSRLYWLYIVLSFIPFMIFNYLLTSIPIVLYNPDAMWGAMQAWNGRVFTIPVEDFFYNFSMLSFYLLVYLYFKKRWNVEMDEEKN
jgi:lycopene cyclase domain-containing protein